jgi:hypothetical protein
MAGGIAAQDLRIETELESDLPSVALDRVQVQQVLATPKRQRGSQRGSMAPRSTASSGRYVNLRKLGPLEPIWFS